VTQIDANIRTSVTREATIWLNCKPDGVMGVQTTLAEVEAWAARVRAQGGHDGTKVRASTELSPRLTATVPLPATDPESAR